MYIPSENIIVRNVRMENVTCEKNRYGVLITGLPDLHNVYNISVDNCHFNNVSKNGNSISGAKEVTFDQLYINRELIK